MKKIISPSKSVSSLNVSQIAQKNWNQPFTFQSQSPSQNQNQQSNVVNNKKYPTYANQEGQSDKDQQTEQNSSYREHLQKQYKMRVQSVIKGYQVKLSRQQETFQLKQMKYQEEIQYLKRQVKELSIFGCKDNSKGPGLQDRCSICSNGEVVNFMKNMLQAVQNDHRGCISEKAITNAQIITLQQKIKVLQIQNQQLQQRSQKLKQQNKQLKTQKESWEREKREKQRQHRQLQRNFQVKEMAFEQENIKNIAMQKQLQNQIKKVQLKHIQAINSLQNGSQHLSKTFPLGQFSQQEQYGKDIYQNQQNYMFRDIQNHPESIPLLRPSLRSNSGPYTTSLNSRQSNSLKKSTIAAHWRTKMQQSYADYAKSKRKSKKDQGYYHGTNIIQNFAPTSQNFDTFRPTVPPLNTSSVPSNREKIINNLIAANYQKYNYLN